MMEGAKEREEGREKRRVYYQKRARNMTDGLFKAEANTPTAHAVRMYSTCASHRVRA